MLLGYLLAPTGFIILAAGGALAQPLPPGDRLQSYSVPLNDFDLLAIGIALVIVLVILGVRKFSQSRRSKTDRHSRL